MINRKYRDAAACKASYHHDILQAPDTGRAANDQAAAARLWTLSEDLLGVTWNIA